MKENYFQSKNSCSFIRYSIKKSNKLTLLFLHGIGDSSLSYTPFHETNKLANFNILTPDLLGYGKSSKLKTYSFKKQVEIIANHIVHLEKNTNIEFNSIIVIPHSMASIHAIKLYNSGIKNKIKGIINIEGTITQYGSFISERVKKIYLMDKFQKWFENFKEIQILNKFIKQFNTCKSYYASLKFCDPKAFLQNALELRKLSTSSTGKYQNIYGKKFANIRISKIYCYGDKSLSIESIDFLHENNIPTMVFKTNNHFLMLQCFNEFCEFILKWVKNKY
ncbi:alpha/beta hydrolase [Gammaproteobacteria bacterium]|nr:alpha/beta hydrolase [Gammaproteobacteria bacterium]